MSRDIRDPIGLHGGLLHAMARRGDKPIVNQRGRKIALDATVGRGTGLMVEGRALGLIAIGSSGAVVPVRAR